MKKIHQSTCIGTAALAFAFLWGCGSQSPSVPLVQAGKPAANDYTLDLVVYSPIAIVQYKTGEIDLLFPNIDDHPFGFVKGLNDCPLEDGRRNYRLDLKNTTSSTSVDPTHLMPDEVKIDNNTETVHIDPFNVRFLKISLPPPKEIRPIHVDDEGMSIYIPGQPAPKGHLYPTQIALRYTVPADPQVTLVDTQNSNSVCSNLLQPVQLDKELVLAVGMGPAVDDQDHAHAQKAFRAERDFLPDLKREIDYPMATPVKSREVKPRHRASDCQAPTLLVTNADPTPPVRPEHP
jgi:hypothetical protein